MIEDYEVVNSIHIGDKEIVLCENMKDPQGHYYMTCYAERNELFEYFTDAQASDNYLEIAEIYSSRLAEQISKTKAIIEAEKAPLQVITAGMCNQNIFSENMEDKILVVKPKVLRAEYRTATHQIILCTGGNGARPDTIGSAVFHERLFDGTHSRFERVDILGELKPEYYPDWLKTRLEIKREIKENPAVFEYGDKHFVPVGLVDKRATFETITKNCETDPSLKMWCKEYKDVKGTPKVEYNYTDFYEASNKSDADIFKCVENGKYYLPADNELFIYNGRFNKYTPLKDDKETQKQHPKKKKNKEMER